MVRVNRLETGLTGEDLQAVTGPHLYCVMLPKVQSPADVVEVDNLLKHFERRESMEVGRIFIDPALETAQGIRQSYEIAIASPRVAHMGASGGKGGDTARSIGFQWTPEGIETLYLRSKVLVDVRAAGIPYPMSGGWMDVHDLDGLRASAQEAKRLGYTGMHLIHPSHVPVVNEVFTPTDEEVNRWQGASEGHGTTAGPKAALPLPTTATWWTLRTKKQPAACWLWPGRWGCPERERPTALRPPAQGSYPTRDTAVH